METPNRRHSASVLLRFDPEQLTLIDQAAENAGLNRTSWLRLVVLRTAKDELGKAPGKGKGKRRPSP